MESHRTPPAVEIRRLPRPVQEEGKGGAAGPGSWPAWWREVSQAVLAGLRQERGRVAGRSAPPADQADRLPLLPHWPRPGPHQEHHPDRHRPRQDVWTLLSAAVSHRPASDLGLVEQEIELNNVVIRENVEVRGAREGEDWDIVDILSTKRLFIITENIIFISLHCYFIPSW